MYRGQTMRGRVIAGLGCRRGCSMDDILLVLRRTGTEVAAIAVPAFKADEPGVREAARVLGLPIIRVDDAPLARAQPRCETHSNAAKRATGAEIKVPYYLGLLAEAETAAGRPTIALALLAEALDKLVNSRSSDLGRYGGEAF